MDHSLLTEYKVFVNPSISEVLCTTIVEVSYINYYNYYCHLIYNFGIYFDFFLILFLNFVVFFKSLLID